MESVFGNIFSISKNYDHLLINLQVALKFISKKDKDATSMKTYQRVHREIRNMKKLTHANITEFYESK